MRLLAVIVAMTSGCDQDDKTAGAGDEAVIGGDGAGAGPMQGQNPATQPGNGQAPDGTASGENPPLDPAGDDAAMGMTDMPAPDAGVDAFGASPMDVSDPPQAGECSPDGMADPCYDGPDATRDMGTCEVGTQTCQGGEWGACEGQTTPAEETCDGTDQDCDGEVDEGLTLGGSCTPEGPGDEACRVGRLVCLQGVESCEETSQGLETCNGEDDDCDGELDEDVDLSCYTANVGCERLGDAWRCEGVCQQGERTGCEDGELTGFCVGQVAPHPFGEQCGVSPAVDDDCDGMVDEDCPCTVNQECYTGPENSVGVGTCRFGTQQCLAGVFGFCNEQVTPQPETCDNAGQDNDCDGDADEVPGGGFCFTGMSGRCAVGTWACDNSQSQCAPDNEPQGEACNFSDDDCDGRVDEDFNLDSNRNRCGNCFTSCGGGQDCCGGACVNRNDDEDHCGQCGRRCDPGETCSAGNCRCGNGFSECPDGCRDLMNDTRHCGSCGNVCTGGRACIGGDCVCQNGTTWCSGACRNLRVDDDHCGQCNASCSGPGACVDGDCECEDNCGNRECGPSPNGCGDCGTCPDGEHCDDGTCEPDPPECGDDECNGDETCQSCPHDCDSCPVECGDDECNGDEDCESCPQDCGECEPRCGDDECNGDEDCRSCAADCGACPESAGNPCPASGSYGNPLAGNPSPDPIQTGVGFLEGPVWVPERGLLFYTNFEGNGSDGRIRTYDPQTGALNVYLEGIGANGLATATAGNVVACTHQSQELLRISVFNPGNQGGVPGGNGYNFAPFNSPNDAVVRADGHIYFTDPDYNRGGRDGQSETAYYHITPDGEVSPIGAFDQPNGIILSPDGHFLYVGGLVNGQLRRHVVNADGSVQSSSTVIRSIATDGMAVDCAGNLYLTKGGSGAPEVTVVNPSGGTIGTITGFTGGTTNAAFGGQNQRTLFVTTSSGLFSVDLAVPGLPN